MAKYNNLNKAGLTVDFLHSNSTNHEFLFGAIVELVDNSRDANAKNLEIYTVKSDSNQAGFYLCFKDDGEGMSPDELNDVILFGKSSKRAGENKIGHYGNGLKSGSMRIGKDMIIFTKKNQVLSALFLCRSFMMAEGLSGVVPVPIPSFRESTKEPYYVNTDLDLEESSAKHQLELDLIFKYSPFKTKDELLSQFDKIQSGSGTIVVVYNLKLKQDGLPELDIEADKEDIRMADMVINFTKNSQQEHVSLRSYLSIIYLDPKMKIYLQRKKVQTKRFDRFLYKPHQYKYSSTRFKAMAEKAKKEAHNDYKQALNEQYEAESQLSFFRRQPDFENNTHDKRKYVDLKREVERLGKIAKDKKTIFDMKTKQSQIPIHLTFTFGVNIHNRNADGFFIYNSNRLILMFQHPKSQDSDYRGIVGIVNVPYLVMEPTSNKQMFTDQTELNCLSKAMTECRDEYYNYLNISLDTYFWSQFGYLDNRMDHLPLEDKQFKKARYQYLPQVLQCDKCLKWRSLTCHSSMLEPDFSPQNWCCEISTDPERQSCNLPEYLPEIAIKDFIPKRRTDDQSQAETPGTSNSRAMPNTSNQSRLSEPRNFVVPPKLVATTLEREIVKNKINLVVTESVTPARSIRNANLAEGVSNDSRDTNRPSTSTPRINNAPVRSNSSNDRSNNARPAADSQKKRKIPVDQTENTSKKPRESLASPDSAQRRIGKYSNLDSGNSSGSSPGSSNSDSPSQTINEPESLLRNTNQTYVTENHQNQSSNENKTEVFREKFRSILHENAKLMGNEEMANDFLNYSESELEEISTERFQSMLVDALKLSIKLNVKLALEKERESTFGIRTVSQR